MKIVKLQFTFLAKFLLVIVGILGIYTYINIQNSNTPQLNSHNTNIVKSSNPIESVAPILKEKTPLETAKSILKQTNELTSEINKTVKVVEVQVNKEIKTAKRKAHIERMNKIMAKKLPKLNCYETTKMGKLAIQCKLKNISSQKDRDIKITWIAPNGKVSRYKKVKTPKYHDSLYDFRFKSGRTAGLWKIKFEDGSKEYIAGFKIN